MACEDGDEDHDHEEHCDELGQDINNDGVINVVDVVYLVNYILGDPDINITCGDVNGDDNVNVVDVVQIVNYILGGGTASLHNSYNVVTTAYVMIADNDLSVKSDGCIQGVQLTLTHDFRLLIDLEDYLVSDYVTTDNTTRLMVVSQASCIESIGTTVGDFNVTDAVMSSHLGESVDTEVLAVSPFEVKVSGPNPFNPSTSLNVVVPTDGYVSVKIYNILGQEVAILQDGFMAENLNGYTINWNASNLASGIYLVQAMSEGYVSTQKVTLIK